jgi:hypothetical protein
VGTLRNAQTPTLHTELTPIQLSAYFIEIRIFLCFLISSKVIAIGNGKLVYFSFNSMVRHSVVLEIMFHAYSREQKGQLLLKFASSHPCFLGEVGM